MNIVIAYQSLAAILSLAIGLFVLFNNPKKAINRIFFFLSILITGYAGANILIEYNTLTFKDSVLAYKTAIFFASLQPPVLILFSWYFPRLNTKVTLRKIFFVWTTPLFLAALSFSNLYVRKIEVVNGIRFIDFGVLYSVFAINFCLFLIYGFLRILKIHNDSVSGVEKNQIKYVLIGLVFAYSVGAVFSLLLPVFWGNSAIEFIGPIGPLILVVFMAYAITKHKLMDIKIVIKKTVGYSILTALLTGVLVSIVLSGGMLFSGITGYSSVWSMVVGVFIIALIFHPLREKIQQGIDRLFFKGKYDYKEAVGELSRMSASAKSLNELLEMVKTNVLEVFKAKECSVFVLEEKKQAFVPKSNISQENI